jgi:hypothetical protein
MIAIVRRVSRRTNAPTATNQAKTRTLKENLTEFRIKVAIILFRQFSKHQILVTGHYLRWCFLSTLIWKFGFLDVLVSITVLYRMKCQERPEMDY